jgi:glycosyltransferase involved in cell wall biosynthesis
MGSGLMGKIEGGRRSRGGTPAEKPLVTVITAVLNGAGSMERSMTSVIGQTFTSFEYIVIDGGSRDGTVDILRRAEGSIDYWLSEPDNGIYDALNRGIALARGEWIYFLGADDALADLHVLEKVFARRRDGLFIYGDVLHGDSGAVYGGPFSRRMLTKRNICQQGIFYRSELFRRLGPFDMGYPLLGDWLFNMKAFSLKESKPEYLDMVIAAYSLAGASSRSLDLSFYGDRLRLIRRYLGTPSYIYALACHIREMLAANWRKYVARPAAGLFRRAKGAGQ